jgi:hypothetical protein
LAPSIRTLTSPGDRVLQLLLLACLPAPFEGGDSTVVDDTTTDRDDSAATDTAGADGTGDDGDGADGSTEDGNGDDGTDGDGTTDDGTGDDGGSDGTDDSGTDTGPIEDADEDGWTVDEGDCDDDDRQIHPELSDEACDGADQDCDGRSDEDFALDVYEPNDTQLEWTDLGDLKDEIVVEGYLFPTADADGFYAWVTDYTWTSFSFAGTVTPPADVDLMVQVWRYGESDSDWVFLFENDTGGDGDPESFAYDGEVLVEDSGFYAVVVVPYGDGATCDGTYAVAIEG